MPAAIIIAGALIALAIIWVKQPPKASSEKAPSPFGEINMRPVSAKDHIYGNPNASIKIVEYSDPSCPFCKLFNPTMVQIMNEYGPSGKVAWVYRHFPLDKPDQNGFILHKNAGNEAQAMECAAGLGGNEKFWEFEKKLYEITPAVTKDTPEGLDQKKLPEIAESVGIDKVSFNQCLSSGQYRDRVEVDYADGINAGVSGTPYSIIVTPSGNKIPLVGGQPYANIKTAIETLLNQQ